MALEFDISNSPPSLAEITAEREQAEKERAIFRKKNIYFLIYMIIIVGSMLGFILLVAVPSIREDDAHSDIVFMFTYMMPYLIFAVFVFANRLHIKNIEKPSKVLDARISTLQEAVADKLAEVAGLWLHHNEIVLYQEKVTAQGRSLVSAEIDAMRLWVDAQKVGG